MIFEENIKKFCRNFPILLYYIIMIYIHEIILLNYSFSFIINFCHQDITMYLLLTHDIRNINKNIIDILMKN